MESFLLQKLNALNEEQRRILRNLNNDMNRPGTGGLTVSCAQLTLGKKEITVMPHGRCLPSPLHGHNYVELMAVVRGGFTHTVNGRRVVMGEGDLLFMNRHVLHSIDKPSSRDMAFNVIMSSKFISGLTAELEDTVFSRFLSENERADGAGIYLHFRTKGKKQLENLLENLLYELTEYTADSSILNGTVSLLFRYLSMKHGELLVGGSFDADKETRRMQAVISYIRSDYRNASLTELAGRLGVTSPYLSKQINKYFHKSFKELLVDERMRLATELLSTTDMQIGSIIRTVGYENASYFHREFRRRTGKTPLAIRKDVKGK